MPAGVSAALVESAIRRIGSTICLNPDRIRNDLVALGVSLGNRASELAGTEMELLRLSNVSSERFLTPFLDAADRLFYSTLRRSWIPSALFFLQPLRDLFGTAPAPAPMPRSDFRCLGAFRILSAIAQIEGHLRAMDAIFNQMEPAFRAGAQRIQEVRGSMVPGTPADDPGRGSRMLSVAEQAALSTVRALRQEVEIMRSLVQAALREFFPILPPSFQRLNQPMG